MSRHNVVLTSSTHSAACQEFSGLTWNCRQELRLRPLLYEQDLSDHPRPRIGPNNSPASNIYFNFMGQRHSMDTANEDSLRRQQSSTSTSQSEQTGARQLSFGSLSDTQSRPPLPAWDSAAEAYLVSLHGSQSTTEPNTPAAPDMTAAGPSDRSDSADTRRFESSHSQASQASLESLREAAQGVSAGVTPTGSVSEDEESDLGTPPHLTPSPSPLRVSFHSIC